MLVLWQHFTNGAGHLFPLFRISTYFLNMAQGMRSLPNYQNITLYFLIFFLTRAIRGTQEEVVHIRLADGVDRRSLESKAEEPPTIPPVDTPSSTSKPLPAPARPSGPRLLREMDGESFALTKDGYNYNVKMFQTVTRRRSSENTPVVLGVWDKWVVNGKDEAEDVNIACKKAQAGEGHGVSMSFRMLYQHGDPCPHNTSVLQSVTVDFLCLAPSFTTVPGLDSEDSTGKPASVSDMDGSSHFTTWEEETDGQTSLGTRPGVAKDMGQGLNFRLMDAVETPPCHHRLTLDTPVPCAVLARDMVDVAPPSHAGVQAGGAGKGRKGKRKLSKGQKKRNGRRLNKRLLVVAGELCLALRGPMRRAGLSVKERCTFVARAVRNRFWKAISVPLASLLALTSTCWRLVSERGFERREGGLEALVEEMRAIRVLLTTFLGESRAEGGTCCPDPGAGKCRHGKREGNHEGGEYA